MKPSIFRHLQFWYQTFDVNVIDHLELALQVQGYAVEGVVNAVKEIFSQQISGI